VPYQHRLRAEYLDCPSSITASLGTRRRAGGVETGLPLDTLPPGAPLVLLGANAFAETTHVAPRTSVLRWEAHTVKEAVLTAGR